MRVAIFIALVALGFILITSIWQLIVSIINQDNMAALMPSLTISFFITIYLHFKEEYKR